MTQIRFQATPPFEERPQGLRFRAPSTRLMRALVLALGVVLPLLAFAVVAVAILRFGGLTWDLSALKEIHRYASPAHDRLMVFLTQLGLPYGVAPFSALILVLLVARGRRQSALFFALSMGGAAALNQGIKAVFHRARPHIWTSPLPDTGYGFPSGHAMMSMALVASLLVLARHKPARWGIALLGGAFVLAVGLSRIYLGVHYPSDVLAAWSASLLWVSALTLIFFSRAEAGPSPSPHTPFTEAGTS